MTFAVAITAWRLIILQRFEKGRVASTPYETAARNDDRADTLEVMAAAAVAVENDEK